MANWPQLPIPAPPALASLWAEHCHKADARDGHHSLHLVGLPHALPCAGPAPAPRGPQDLFFHQEDEASLRKLLGKLRAHLKKASGVRGACQCAPL